MIVKKAITFINKIYFWSEYNKYVFIGNEELEVCLVRIYYNLN